MGKRKLAGAGDHRFLNTRGRTGAGTSLAACLGGGQRFWRSDIEVDWAGLPSLERLSLEGLL